jgi:AcrR family transcriptional regulator
MDLRVKKTRIAIRSAFWSLAMEKGLDRITVSEVCDRAMINRATFYRHYEDLRDLTARGTKEYLDELWKAAEPPPENPAEVDTTVPPWNMVLLFSFVRENAEFFRFALGERGIPQFVSELRRYVAEVTVSRSAAVLKESSRSIVPISLLGKTLAGEFIAMVIWWLEHDCEPDVDTMSYYALSLVVCNTYELMDVSPAQKPDEVFDRLRNITAKIQAEEGV